MSFCPSAAAFSLLSRCCRMFFHFEKSPRTTFVSFFAACVVAFVAAAGHAQPTTSGDSTPTAVLDGYWKVTEVKLVPGSAQAASRGGSAYMGAILEVSKDWMAWRPYKGGGKLSDVCMVPRFLPAAIQCSYGSFGPKGARVTLENGRLFLDWYDDSKLVLQRID